MRSEKRVKYPVRGEKMGNVDKITVDSENLSLYEVLIKARTAGNKNAGQERAKYIRPLLNILAGKTCAWNEYQCERSFENLLRRYIEPDKLGLLLAAAGYGERYSILSNATKRRLAYAEENYKDSSEDISNKGLERRENTALASMAELLIAEYDRKPSAVIDAILSGFSEQELLSLDIQVPVAQKSGSEEIETKEVDLPSETDSAPQTPNKKRAMIIGIVASVAVLLVVVSIFVLSHNKAPEGKLNGGTPPRIVTNWDVIDSDSYYLGYGIMSVMGAVSDWDAERDYQSELKSYAEEGKDWAQFELGSAYLLLRDYKQAKEWMERAANQNYTSAQVILGIMCFNGVGVEQNEKEALKWALLAAQQDNPAGQLLVAEMYRLGYGKTDSLEESAYWYEKALEHGHYALAEYYLAEYYAAEGDHQNIEKAISLYERAFDDGYKDAAIKLTELRN